MTLNVLAVNSFIYIHDVKFIVMLKITYGVLEFLSDLTLAFPTNQRSRGHVFILHQKRCYNHLRKYVISVRGNRQCIGNEAFLKKTG